MAKKPHNTIDDIWTTLLAKRRTAVDALAAGVGDRDKHWVTILACEDTLLGYEARGLMDILHKLSIMWAGCRGSEDPTAQHQVRILDELAYIIGPVEAPAD